MLIKGLYDYYDILREKGEVLPDGYSIVKVKYRISITENGKIDDILEYYDETHLYSQQPKPIAKAIRMPRELKSRA